VQPFTALIPKQVSGGNKRPALQIAISEAAAGVGGLGPGFRDAGCSEPAASPHGAVVRRVVEDNGDVPRISAFYGIVVTMYWRDHPPPHFHAAYGGQVAEIAIDTLEVIDGWLPPRALRLVVEWARLHQDELRDNWVRARAHDRLVAVDPLP